MKRKYSAAGYTDCSIAIRSVEKPKKSLRPIIKNAFEPQTNMWSWGEANLVPSAYPLLPILKGKVLGTRLWRGENVWVELTVGFAFIADWQIKMALIFFLNLILQRQSTCITKLKQMWITCDTRVWTSLYSAVAESRYFEPLKERKIWFENWMVREDGGKITVLDWGGGTAFDSSYREVQEIGIPHSLIT